MAKLSGTVYDSAGAAVAGRIVRAYRRDAGGLLGATVSSDGLPGNSDSDFDKVSLLLHMNGVDGSAIFLDDSPSPKAITAYGGAKISTAQSKWGGASGYFDGVDDYVSAPSSSDFNFGTGDFTIEAWVYQSQQSGLAMVAGQQGGNASDGLFQFRISDGKPEFVFCSNGSTNIVSFSSQQPIQQSTWVHIEVSRSNGVGRVFVGGLLTAQANISGSLYNSNRPLTVGALNYGVGTNLLGFFGGYIGDLRITNGVARNSANFTPPPASFPNSQQALQLGEYVIDAGAYAGEAQVIFLDDDGGVLQNDLILRAYPV